MTEITSDAVELRNWLVANLCTRLGCDADEIDLNASLKDVGVGSRDALELSGELAELLGRPVSPVDFWQNPTINALVEFLTEPIAVVGLGCRFPGGISAPEALWQFLWDGECAVGEVPSERWLPFDDGSPEVGAALARTTRWGSFLDDIDAFDAEFFEIVFGKR